MAALLLGSAIPGSSQNLQIAPDELVRKVVAHELRAADAPGHYMYRMHNESPDGSTTKEVIETKSWLIGRLIRRNGRPLPPDQRQKEDEQLTRLLTNEAALQKERAGLQRDERHVRDLFKALPEAFDYEYDGSQDGEDADVLVRLKFHPNPKFQPPTEELRVLKGMEGTMVIDIPAERIAQIEGRLVRPVDFGWGILARLRPGGRFLLQQRNVGYGRWQMTRLALDFTGTILLFKPLKIDSTRTTSDFRRMPDRLTLKEGLELLKRQDEMADEGHRN